MDYPFLYLNLVTSSMYILICDNIESPAIESIRVKFRHIL